MKKLIVLLLTVLLCGCSAEKPVETLLSMQTEPAASETAVAETPETTAPTKTDSEETKSETSASVESKYPEQESMSVVPTAKPVKKPIPTDTQETPNLPAEASQAETPTEIPETAETPPESATAPPEAEFDVNYWVGFATAYAFQIGLEIDPTAMDCWDNPTTANADCIYLERDLTHRLDRYNNDEDITAVNIWAESLENGNYLIYIAYA